MIRSHIAQMTGHVVGYKSPTNVETMPVRILDSRLWEIHTTPAWHMEVSMEMRPSRQQSVQIGYPVLALYGAHGEFQGQRAELEAWLRETDCTLEDLLNEQGERMGDLAKGVFPKGDFAKGDFPKGVLIRVVSGRHLFADYEAKRAEEIAHDKAVSAAWKLKMDLFQHATDTSKALNEILLNVGVTSDDGREIVQVQGIGSKRVNLDVDVLMSLTQMAMHMSRRCDWCGAGAPLLPHDTEAQAGLWLCAECHPRVRV